VMLVCFAVSPGCSESEATGTDVDTGAGAGDTGTGEGATSDGDEDTDTDTDGDTDADTDMNTDVDADTDTGPFTSAWRPFSDDSPWNTPIPDNPTLHPESDELIRDLETSSPFGEHLDVNIPGYSIPLYWADENTPAVEVHCRIGGMGFTGDNGFDATAMVPIPADAAPDPESDRHLLIVDRSTNLEWGMWDTVNDNLDLRARGQYRSARHRGATARHREPHLVHLARRQGLRLPARGRPHPGGRS
jgi:hypothetical protein